MHATVDAQAQALVALKARQGQVVTRMQALAQADRFLHPSREIAIFGYKPAGNVHTVDEGDAQPSDSNV
jgi:hypothetical protein